MSIITYTMIDAHKKKLKIGKLKASAVNCEMFVSVGENFFLGRQRKGIREKWKFIIYAFIAKQYKKVVWKRKTRNFHVSVTRHVINLISFSFWYQIEILRNEKVRWGRKTEGWKKVGCWKVIYYKLFANPRTNTKIPNLLI